MKQLFVFVIVFFAIALSSVYAQDSTKAGRYNKRNPAKSEKRQRINALLKLEEEQDPVFRKHSVFGIKAASDGYGISFEKGYYKGPKKALIFQAELNEKKHPKEEKTASGQNIFGQANSFIYGKANNFYQFKLGVGQQYIIGGKANKNGVNVSAIYAGGFSLGMLKPYYIDVERQGTGERLRKKFTDTADGYTYGIIGASGFTHGWSELKLKPGIHAKLAMRFDYGHFNESISAIEAGVNAEYYFNQIQQIVLNTEKHFFFNGYVTIMFGRRK